jgi:hypothetical protein
MAEGSLPIKGAGSPDGRAAVEARRAAATAGQDRQIRAIAGIAR